MRVLFVNYEFPPLGGGGGTTTKFLAGYLARTGVEITVLTAGYRGLPKTELVDGYRIVRVPCLRSQESQCSPLEMASFVLCAIVPMLRMIRSWKPALLHIFFAVPTGPLGLLAKKITGLPYILYLLGGDVPGFLAKETGWQHRMLKGLSHSTWKNAAFTVANSGGLHDLAKKAFPDVPVQVISNGVDTSEFKPPIVDERTKNQNSLIMLFVGRFARQKGLPVLLQALDNMLGLDTKIKPSLLVVGDGPDRAEYEAFIGNHNLKGSVRLLGWVPLKALCGIYNSADIFVLPSIAEGMPSVVLQALSCGRPVVSSKVFGSEDLIRSGHNGYLVAPNDALALTNAIRHFLDDAGLLQTMKTNARQSVLEYDWKNIASDFMGLYQTAQKGMIKPGETAHG